MGFLLIGLAQRPGANRATGEKYCEEGGKEKKKNNPKRHFLSQLRHMAMELWARWVFICGERTVRVWERRRGRGEKETHVAPTLEINARFPNRVRKSQRTDSAVVNRSPYPYLYPTCTRAHARTPGILCLANFHTRPLRRLSSILTLSICFSFSPSPPLSSPACSHPPPLKDCQ